MTVIPLNARRAEKPADVKPEPVATHLVLPAAARNAMTSLEGRVNALKRIFAGPSASLTMAAEIERLTNEIRTEAGRVARFSR